MNDVDRCLCFVDIHHTPAAPTIRLLVRAPDEEADMNTLDDAAQDMTEHLNRGLHVPAHPFSETFPPPYRVLLLLSLGVFGWALNLHGLQRLGIDTEEVLSSGKQARNRRRDDDHEDEARLPLFDANDSRPGGEPGNSNATFGYASTTRPGSVYAIALLVAAWALFNWAVFRTYVSQYQGDPSGRHAQAMQGIAVLAVLVAAIWPGSVLWKGRRKQFASSLVPLFHPTHLLRRPPTFPSILLADILTSFAKVFGDVWLTACFLVPRKEHHTWWNGRGSWAVPALVSLPYAIRFLQCLSEYRYAQNTLLLTDATTSTTNATATTHPVRIAGKALPPRRAKKPLANALKYASAFPVIWISASQSSRAGGVPDADDGSNMWWYVWLLSVMVNSLFSFWWDVTNDWGLELLKPETWTLAKHLLQGTPHKDAPIAPSLHRRGLSVWPAPRGASASEDEGSDEVDELSSLHKRPPPVNGSSSRLFGGHARAISTMILRRDHTRPSPTSSHHRASHPHTMLFSPSIYHGAIILDLILRFTWSFKLSPHLAQLVELESGVFVLELAEIMRRTGWVFLRVEWEVVKRARAGEILDAAGVEERLEDGGADTLASLQQQQQHDDADPHRHHHHRLRAF